METKYVDIVKNIVLIGFMGTGKTSTGQILASHLARSFIDIDQRIEHENSMSIADMFSLYGEPYFRERATRDRSCITLYKYRDCHRGWCGIST